jgi:hypothetical protein
VIEETILRVLVGLWCRFLLLAALCMAGAWGAGALRAEAPADPQRPAVSGTVRDDAGEPVVNVEVLALRPVSGQRRLNVEGRDRTDDRGMYRIALREPADGYVVLVRGDSGSTVRADPRQPQADAILVFPSIYYPDGPRPAAAARHSRPDSLPWRRREPRVTFFASSGSP